MSTLALALFTIPFGLMGYAYVVYPLLLRMAVLLPRRALSRRRIVSRSELPFVTMDATVRIQPGSLSALVDAFADPTVGVASGFDSSVGTETDATGGESGYVGYEMWVRELETRLDGIVGASGCFYGIRRDVHDT